MTSNSSTRTRLSGSIAALTRTLPDMRGLGRLYLTANQLLLKLGVEPIAAARMQDGTTMLVDLRSQTEVHAFYRGVYDPLLLNAIKALLSPADLFLDIGANVGFYTVAIAAHLRSLGGAGMVVSFEPLQANHSRLSANLTRNQLESLVTTFQLGLSSRSDRLQIMLREDFAAGSSTGNASISTGNTVFERDFPSETIRVEPLDAIWPDLKASLSGRRLSLIKMDIEGHEDLCLSGATHTLAAERPIVLMEINKPYYNARCVDVVQRFQPPLLPVGYRIVRHHAGAWTSIPDMGPCSELDNVFLVPEEKISFFERCLAPIRLSGG